MMLRTAMPASYTIITIIGGGCYGTYYLRQLHRARKAGAITWTKLQIVDKDPHCQIAANPNSNHPCELITQDWHAFMQDYLNSLASNPDTEIKDAIVPSPLMPHLLYDWLFHRAQTHYPHHQILSVPIEPDMQTPWHSPGAGNTYYASFATWTCPINCIEPRLCPHTKALRDWTMPDAAATYVGTRNGTLAGPLIFHCTHRAYGVGMIDLGDVIQADQFIKRAAVNAPVDVMVGTVSHCHGAFNMLRIGVESSS